MLKRSDQDLKAPPAGEDPLSPWRAAKPRRSLRDIAGEPESPRTLAENESPPNSSHKESTRLESGLRGAGGLDLSQGASPALSVTAESKTQTKTFTKLKSSTNSKSRLNSRKVEQKKNQQGSEEEEEDDEEEQPAASQFHQPTCFWKWVGGTNP